MVTNKIYILLLAASVLFLCSPFTQASTVHFRMDVSDTQIGLGGESTIGIYAYAQHVSDGDGIISWQLDLVLDAATESGIVQVDTGSISVLPDGFYDVSGALFQNDPIDGVVRALGGFMLLRKRRA